MLMHESSTSFDQARIPKRKCSGALDWFITYKYPPKNSGWIHAAVSNHFSDSLLMMLYTSMFGWSHDHRLYMWSQVAWNWCSLAETHPICIKFLAKSESQPCPSHRRVVLLCLPGFFKVQRTLSGCFDVAQDQPRPGAGGISSTLYDLKTNLPGSRKCRLKQLPCKSTKTSWKAIFGSFSVLFYCV